MIDEEKKVKDYNSLDEIETEIAALEHRIYKLEERHEEISKKGRKFLRIVLGEKEEYYERNKRKCDDFVAFCKEKEKQNGS